MSRRTKEAALKYVDKIPQHVCEWLIAEYNKNERTVSSIVRDCKKRFGTTFDTQVMPDIFRKYNVTPRTPKQVARISLKEKGGAASL